MLSEPCVTPQGQEDGTHLGLVSPKLETLLLIQSTRWERAFRMSGACLWFEAELCPVLLSRKAISKAETFRRAV